MGRACRGDLAYHSAVQGIEDLLLQNRCPRAGPTTQPRPLASEDGCLHQQGLLAADGHQLDYLHCGVFGDPHIRTFSNDFHSCAVQGAWPLIDNDFLYVQATSSPVRMGSHTTALTKVSIVHTHTLFCSAFHRHPVLSCGQWRKLLQYLGLSLGRNLHVAVLPVQSSVPIIHSWNKAAGHKIKCQPNTFHTFHTFQLN